MKTLFILVACIVAVVCGYTQSIQTSTYRNNQLHTNETSIVITHSGGVTNVSHDVYTTSGVYRVDYRFNSSYWSTPLTYPPGDPHHDATIYVTKGSTNVGTPISGTYVNGKCKMCDDPLKYVQQAIEEEEKLRATRVWTNFNNSLPPMPPSRSMKIDTIYEKSSDIHWIKLNVEIGFRPDGTVVWRTSK